MSKNREMTLSCGDPAPAFCLPVVGKGYKEEDVINSGVLSGYRYALVFYPKDSTPGCTQQACDLRDRWEEVPEEVKIFGVSVDPVKSHRKFIDRNGLPYPLLSDENRELVTAYGLWVEKTLYGRKYMGTERTTVVVGADGSIEKVLEKVSPGKHLQMLIEALA